MQHFWNAGILAVQLDGKTFEEYYNEKFKQ
jgi:hypothetical protein